MTIERTFQDIPQDEIKEDYEPPLAIRFGWSTALGWQDLLASKRVLILSEAGVGKTFECQSRQQILWETRAAAFFFDLASLAKSDVRSLLGYEEESRFDRWLNSQSDIATFFLDSIDELQLSLGSFKHALRELKKALRGQLARARIIITSRPVPFDEQLIRQQLPIPDKAETKIDGPKFARIAMGDHSQSETDQSGPPGWRRVILQPLSDQQILEFVRLQGVKNPEAMLEILERRNAMEFARRPQDLIELSADWRDHNLIRTHREQIETNIQIKLKPREDRPEAAQLSAEKAMEGATRLALALAMTRRFSIRHSAEADRCGEDAALDPAKILSDWRQDERKALLERPLFGFASYGRVRFHHRSVVEYLAAKRLSQLRQQGMSRRVLEQLIFAHTKGKVVVRPSKRPIAAWLAAVDPHIFAALRDNEPAVLLTEGDPESLPLGQRSQALRAFVIRYGVGGWRGLHVPEIQIIRFASEDLAADIQELWSTGIENPEIRRLLLHLVEAGKVKACSSIAFTVWQDGNGSLEERLLALEALIAISDASLTTIIDTVLKGASPLSPDLVDGALLRLFPRHISVDDLCRVLKQQEPRRREIGDFLWYLTHQLLTIDLSKGAWEILRDRLTSLVQSGLRWQDQWPHLASDRTDLSIILAVVCLRGLKFGATANWLRACVVAIRLRQQMDSSSEVYEQLKRALADLSAEENAHLFWIEDSFIQSVRPVTNARERLNEILFDGAVQINPARDRGWIKAAMADTSRSSLERAMVTEAGIQLARTHANSSNLIQELKPLVADLPKVVAEIDLRLASMEQEMVPKRWQLEEAERNKKREAAHATWVEFWRTLSEQPDKAFADDRVRATTWHLWQAMEKAGKESRESGWNREFIEAAFDRKTADRLRVALMDQWRADTPTLPSERPIKERNTYLLRWLLGLAGIYAESEDSEWARKLSRKDALLAARYVPLELDKFPLWLEALSEAHPEIIDEVLGVELSQELSWEAPDDWRSTLLQNVSHASKQVVARFLPRLHMWLDANHEPAVYSENRKGAIRRLRQVISILETHGDHNALLYLQNLAQTHLAKEMPEDWEHVWLPILVRQDPVKGVEMLTRRVSRVEPSQYSKAVIWLSTLFGEHYGNVSLASFDPPILLELLRLAHFHIRPEDDIKRVGGYTPDARDDAQLVRNGIVTALLNAKGEKGWAAKLKMAADPACAYFKDRIRAVAEERWAQEIDTEVLDDAQAVALDRTGEAPPRSNSAMFDVLIDRLERLDDLLLQDSSPRAVWALIEDEFMLRREIARELDHLAKGLYKIDQESVTADENETDIRLRSTVSEYQAVIELKLGNKKRSAAVLRNTLRDQIVQKYMASQTCRSGCLLISLARDRPWSHPKTKARMTFSQLISFLREEANTIIEQLGGDLRLHVHPLDLRPRLAQPKRKPGKRVKKRDP